MNFSENLKIGAVAQKTDSVSEKNIATVWGTGGLAVYSTPAMIALMECAAVTAVDYLLPPGCSTVGSEVDARHISASPPGMKITAKAELTGIDGRALSFKVEAFDEAGKIGEGTHGRFIVENEKFLAKVKSKEK